MQGVSWEESVLVDIAGNPSRRYLAQVSRSKDLTTEYNTGSYFCTQVKQVCQEKGIFGVRFSFGGRL